METNNTNNKYLVTLFNNARDAEHAYHALTNNGYTNDDITVIMSDETRDKYFTDSDLPTDTLGTKTVEGLGVGSATGGALGALTAAIMAIGTVLTVPPLGLVVAGPIAAGLAGAGAGSAVGGLVGALIGYGVPDETAKHYESEIRAGNILLGVNVPADQYENLKRQIEPVTV
jgi:hypothetical protein